MEQFFYEDVFCNDLDDLADILCELLVDKYEDRLLPDFEEIEGKQLLKALKESIDYDKFKEVNPKLCYGNNKFVTINREQLIDYLVI